MKRSIPTFFLLLLPLFTLIHPAAGQDFEEGVEHYQKQQYAEAVEIFNGIDTPEAYLFSGKSYFAMGRYLRAKSQLERVDSSNAAGLVPEANYTAALADIQLRQFGPALDRLNGVANRSGNQLAVDSRQLYRELLGYLTLEQRRQAFQSTVDPQVRHDLIRSAIGTVSWSTARVLLETYRQTLPPGDTPRLSELEELLSDSASYSMRNAGTLSPPEGIIYDIGAALPLFEPDDPDFAVSRGLYFGYLLAIEEFNENNSGVKAVLRHRDTGGSGDGVAHVLSDFAWNTGVDAILGPLFSEPARQMAPYAEQYRIPMVAPLANSDDLFTDNPYIYQANATLSTHGREMARFARSMGLDSLAVFAEQGSLGASSAHAFRAEFEKLGGRVPYFFLPDLESEGYEIDTFTRHFTTDRQLIDSLNYQPVEGVYAPFTGQAASTLIDLLLVDLNNLNPGMTVLGSPEWGTVDLPEQRIGNRGIYFSDSFYRNSNSSDVERFTRSYREHFDMEPNRYAMVGYDAASFLLRTLGEVKNPALLKSALKEAPVYNGLISDIDFDGTHINQRVMVFRIDTDGEAIPVNRD